VLGRAASHLRQTSTNQLHSAPARLGNSTTVVARPECRGSGRATPCVRAESLGGSPGTCHRLPKPSLAYTTRHPISGIWLADASSPFPLISIGGLGQSSG
jgi:hypothetical protein